MKKTIVMTISCLVICSGASSEAMQREQKKYYNKPQSVSLMSKLLVKGLSLCGLLGCVVAHQQKTVTIANGSDKNIKVFGDEPGMTYAGILQPGQSASFEYSDMWPRKNDGKMHDHRIHWSHEGAEPLYKSFFCFEPQSFIVKNAGLFDLNCTGLPALENREAFKVTIIKKKMTK